MIGVMLGLASCGERYPDAVDMGVDYSWRSTQDAGAISPLINLTSVPDATKRFRVELVDLDMTMASHGYGLVAYNGKPVIETGAVKDSYVGPRPPPGQTHRYEITVKALDESGEVIGIGQQVKQYPPAD